MPIRHTPRAPLAAQLTELMIATPQVMAIRLARMAAAGQNPSARDRAEMNRMGQEKVLAFSQSWMAMWMNLWLMPLRLMPAFAATLSGTAASRKSLQAQATRASNAMFAAGLAPVHRTAVANARRLTRTGR